VHPNKQKIPKKFKLTASSINSIDNNIITIYLFSEKFPKQLKEKESQKMLNILLNP
jgi:hypothetical protein